MKFPRALLLSSLLSLLSLAKSEPVLIIALPQSDHTEVLASWERGEEILPGALAAIEEAKSSFPSLNLTLFVATSSITRQDFSYSGNVVEIIANLAWQKRLSDIIGVAGVFHPNVLAIFSRIRLRTASLIHFDQAPHSSSVVHYSTASISTLTDSILAFLNVIHPKKVEVITEADDTYYLTISYQLFTKADTISNIQISTIIKRQPFSSIIDRILDFNIHAIVLSASPSTAILFLCEAYKRGLTWPKYAWILHSFRLDDLLQNSTSNKGCTCTHSVQKIFEGVFIFQLTYEGIDEEIMHYQYNNSYAFLLHDSVWNLISSVGGTRSDSHSSEVMTSSPVHDSSKVYVYHNLNCTARFIGIYDGTSSNLTNVSKTIFTDCDLPIINKAPIFIPYLLSLPILSFIFNTILLVLYVIFRNEPSIKSTSVSISMLIFIGCYILIGYSISLIADKQDLFKLDYCMVQIWLGGIGLSMPLILATILVKMLRVYRIFISFKFLKKSVHLSDFALLGYIMLILSPHIILLILWTAIDPQYRDEIFIEHPGYMEKVVICRPSDYHLIWSAIAFVYLILLTESVVIVAIKSRKIRLARFKDTKKVNIFIFLFSIVGKCTFIYWQVLLFLESSFIILYIGHMIIALLCQIFLFVPKVWPAVRKKIIYRNYKYGGH